jgi:hypothetical protein
MALDTAVGETDAVQLPDVSYARSGDVAIAYQVIGDGRPDIVFARGVTGDLLSTWEQLRAAVRGPRRTRVERHRRSLAPVRGTSPRLRVDVTSEALTAYVDARVGNGNAPEPAAAAGST